MANEEELLGGSAAAKYLAVSRSLVYRLHKQGRLAGRIIGGHLFFSRAELDAFKALSRPTGVNLTPKGNAPSLSQPAGATNS